MENYTAFMTCKKKGQYLISSFWVLLQEHHWGFRDNRSGSAEVKQRAGCGGWTGPSPVWRRQCRLMFII